MIRILHGSLMHSQFSSISSTKRSIPCPNSKPLFAKVSLSDICSNRMNRKQLITRTARGEQWNKMHTRNVRYVICSVFLLPHSSLLFNFCFFFSIIAFYMHHGIKAYTIFFWNQCIGNSIAFHSKIFHSMRRSFTIVYDCRSNELIFSISFLNNKRWKA